MRLGALPTKACLGVCCGLLAGCTVGPDYSRPATPIPAAYAGAPSRPIGTSTASLGDLAWWKVFRDPVLQDLMRRAYAGDADVKLAAARLDLARAKVQSTLAGYEPDVQMQANNTRQRISPIGLPKDRVTGNPAGGATILNGQATWEIDFWGKYRRADEAGRALLLSSQAAQQAVMTSLFSAVATAYFSLLALDEQGAAARAGLAMREQGLGLTRARLQRGVSSLSDVRAAEIQTAKARQLVARVQRSTADRESELHALLGETSGEVPRGMTLEQVSLPAVEPGLPSGLLERRPDIRQAEQELIAANASIGVVESAYFPNIGLTAEGGLESTDIAKLFTGNASTWLLQPALNLPVFTGGRIRAQVRQAEARRDISVYQYTSTVEAAFKDVAQALAYRTEANEAEAQQRAVVNAATNATYLARARAKGGVGDLLDVMDAEQMLRSATIDLAGSRFDKVDALVRLYVALGGGWQR